MRGDANLAGSKSVARYQRVNIGTRETHDAPARVWATKPLLTHLLQFTFLTSGISVICMSRDRPWHYVVRATTDGGTAMPIADSTFPHSPGSGFLSR